MQTDIIYIVWTEPVMHVLHMEEASLSWIINIATVAHLPSSVIILPKRQFVWGGGILHFLSSQKFVAQLRSRTTKTL